MVIQLVPLQETIRDPKLIVLEEKIVIVLVVLSFEHNISEKKRIERINNCINELYHLLEVLFVSDFDLAIGCMYTKEQGNYFI